MVARDIITVMSQYFKRFTVEDDARVDPQGDIITGQKGKPIEIYTPRKGILEKYLVVEALDVVNRNKYAHYLIDRVNVLLNEKYDPNPIQIPHTSHNADAFMSWMQAEGGNAWYNPLNTTWVTNDSWIYNSAGVRSYPTFSAGVDAEARTLILTRPELGYYIIRQHLRQNDPPKQTLQAVESSQWGTGGLAVRVLPDVKADYWKYGAQHVFPT